MISWDRRRVATVFPQLSRKFFERAGKPVTIVPVSGATEIAPHLGIADIIVDLTSSGSTLRVHQLHEVATVLESSARLICSPKPSAGGRDALLTSSRRRCRACCERATSATSWRTCRARRSNARAASCPA